MNKIIYLYWIGRIVECVVVKATPKLWYVIEKGEKPGYRPRKLKIPSSPQAVVYSGWGVYSESREALIEYLIEEQRAKIRNAESIIARLEKMKADT